MEVVPTLSSFKKSAMLGNTAPKAIPRKIARKIQMVRYLLRNESFLAAASGNPRPSYHFNIN
jgi:hypothetical protein